MYANTDSLTDQFFIIWEELDNDDTNNPDDDYSGDDEFYRDFYGD